MRTLSVLLLLCLAACDRGLPPQQVEAIAKHRTDQAECSSLAHKSKVKHPTDAQRIISDAMNDCMRKKGYHVPANK